LPAGSLYGTSGDQLYLRVRNENVPGAGHLSPDECARVFELSKTASTSSKSRRSDGVGLDSVTVAARAVGGSAWLTADREHTTFHMRLPAQPCMSVPIPRALLLRYDSISSIPANSPSGAPVEAIQDSPAGTDGQLTAAGPAAELQVEDAPWPLRAPVCIGIDDSHMLRTMHVRLGSRRWVGWRGG
jgi:hypothetical protein